MRKKLLLGLTLTTGLTAPAMAEKWHEVASSDEVIAFADEDSIQANGANKIMEVFQGFDMGQGAGAKIYYTKSRVELDCAGKKVRELRMDDYALDRSMLPPAPLDSNWQEIADGTLGAVYSKMACDGERTNNIFTDPFSAADEYWEYMYYYGE